MSWYGYSVANSDRQVTHLNLNWEGQEEFGMQHSPKHSGDYETSIVSFFQGVHCKIYMLCAMNALKDDNIVLVNLLVC